MGRVGVRLDCPSKVDRQKYQEDKFMFDIVFQAIPGAAVHLLLCL
jgi:hypothetical protein